MTWKSKEDIIELVQGFENLAHQYAERGDSYGIMLIMLHGFGMLARVIIHSANRSSPSHSRSQEQKP